MKKHTGGGPAPSFSLTSSPWYPGSPLVFWALTLALAGFMAGAMIWSAALETSTMDEHVYLMAGVAQILYGNYSFNPDHPPLSKHLAALPLLGQDLRFPAEHPLWRSGNPDAGVGFLYKNRAPPDEILFLARLPFIGVTMAFGIALALWTRWRFGATAGLIALFLYALDPNFIAHGKLATTDVLNAVLFFASCIAWGEYLQSKSRRLLVLAGLLTGLSVATKFSSLTLLGLLPLFYLLRWWQAPKEFTFRGFALSSVALLLAVTLIVGAVYGRHTAAALDGDLYQLEYAVDTETESGRLFHWVGRSLHLPAYGFLRGVATLAAHNERGHRAYLLGEFSSRGWRLYFPVAFLVKSTSAMLIALLAGAALVGSRWRRRGPPGLRETSLYWFLLCAPPLMLFVGAVAANLNIGHRHILPVYPFLFVLAGAVLSRFRVRVLVAVLVTLMAVEHVAVAPHYLSFFNLPSGGSWNGPRYLVDSNIDWGQDLKKLAAYLERRRPERVCLAYFGRGDAAYYGVSGGRIPSTSEVAQSGAPKCVAAISASLLVGIDQGPEQYRWLQERRPDERIGYSIYIYDLE
jgi:4-amino-4-deoxy-L-arabinose transferase-like glycosyltransferase